MGDEEGDDPGVGGEGHEDEEAGVAVDGSDDVPLGPEDAEEGVEGGGVDFHEEGAPVEDVRIGGPEGPGGGEERAPEEEVVAEGRDLVPADELAEHEGDEQGEEGEEGGAVGKADAEKGGEHEEIALAAPMLVAGEEGGARHQHGDVEGVGERAGGGDPERRAEHQEEAGAEGGETAAVGLELEGPGAGLVADEIADAHHQVAHHGDGQGAAEGGNQAHPGGDGEDREPVEPAEQPAPEEIGSRRRGLGAQIGEEFLGGEAGEGRPAEGEEVERQGGEEEENVDVPAARIQVGEGVERDRGMGVAAFEEGVDVARLEELEAAVGREAAEGGRFRGRGPGRGEET